MLISQRTTCSPSTEEEVGEPLPPSVAALAAASVPTPIILALPPSPAIPCFWYSMLRVSLDSWMTATLPLRKYDEEIHELRFDSWYARHKKSLHGHETRCYPEGLLLTKEPQGIATTSK